MKITCACGATIFDHGDSKRHLIADAALEPLLELIDDVIERPGLRRAEARCMDVRKAVMQALRPAWQCKQCRRLYVQDAQGQLQEWVPAVPVRP